MTKRRIGLKLKEFYDYYNNGIINKDSQIMKEIDYLFKYYKLVPKLFLAYNRESYKYKERLDVRITFDTNIRSRKEDLYLEIYTSSKVFNNLVLSSSKLITNETYEVYIDDTFYTDIKITSSSTTVGQRSNNTQNNRPFHSQN